MKQRGGGGFTEGRRCHFAATMTGDVSNRGTMHECARDTVRGRRQRVRWKEEAARAGTWMTLIVFKGGKPGFQIAHAGGRRGDSACHRVLDAGSSHHACRRCRGQQCRIKISSSTNLSCRWNVPDAKCYKNQQRQRNAVGSAHLGDSLHQRVNFVGGNLQPR
jgi:hypothetical protein